VVARIEAGHGKDREAAGGVGAESPRGGPFDDWTIYHIMVDMSPTVRRRTTAEITGWKHPNYAGGDSRAISRTHRVHPEAGVNAVWLVAGLPAKSSTATT